MPVRIHVSDVRKELYRAAGFGQAAGEGSPSTAQLGRWFHEGIGFLIGQESEGSPLREMSELEENLDVWKKWLTDSAYTRFVGPRLTRAQAGLQGVGAEVQAFWKAFQAACHWLAELSWELRSQKASQRTRQQFPMVSLTDLISTEEPVSCQFREPGWKDSVLLTGVADAIVRLKKSNAWCAVEFKLGQTSPIADFGQACLYHLLISSSSPPETNGADSLALVSFMPERKEQLFNSAQLLKARSSIIELIGVIAGVTAGSQQETALPEKENAVEAPKIDVRSRESGKVSKEHREIGERLIKAFQEYHVDVSLDEPIIAGPTFLRFPLKLGPRTVVSRAMRVIPEVQVRLGLHAEPFIRLDRGQLVAEIQRPDRQIVEYAQVEKQLQALRSPQGNSQLPVGVDLSGELVFADLSRPEDTNILVVGTVGSGKSAWLRFAIAGLIESNTPETLKLVVIDPKRNAFHELRNSPYLMRPIVYPGDRNPIHSPIEVLKDLVVEMERRYQMFDGADSIQHLMQRTGKTIPRIVCVCDEYRDLITRDRKSRDEIELLISRLGSKARAAGIHLILATQEPRRETIRGTIDSNMAARISLKAARAIESRMVLGENGAERLLGHGDLLFKDIGDPRRLQAPLLSESDRERIFGKAERAQTVENS